MHGHANAAPAGSGLVGIPPQAGLELPQVVHMARNEHALHARGITWRLACSLATSGGGGLPRVLPCPCANTFAIACGAVHAKPRARRGGRGVRGEWAMRAR